MSYAIETENLTKQFPVIRGYRDFILHPFKKRTVPALNNVSLQVKKGELFGLLGPNGAGKTTLIKILSTLILPTSGRALLNGMDVTRNEMEVKKLAGYVISDERSFYWRLTGRQNLLFFARLNNLSNEKAKYRIAHLLKWLNLEKDADRMFKDYSTGTRKKLAIIRGLLTDPEVLFMDEPTNALDPLTSMYLRKLIREEFVEKQGRSVLLATHNMHEAEALCNRIVMMNKGEVKAVGSIKEIKQKYKTGKHYAAIIQDAAPELLEAVSQEVTIKNVLPISNKYQDIQIEFDTQDDVNPLPFLIEKVTAMQGRIISFYEKEAPLEEVFLSICRD